MEFLWSWSLSVVKPRLKDTHRTSSIGVTCIVGTLNFGTIGRCDAGFRSNKSMCFPLGTVRGASTPH